MERLTNRDKEIPLPNADNALFWARVHEKLAKYEDAEEQNNFKPKPITNADRVRAMTDEELAEVWWERVDCGECPVHKECKLTGQDCKRLALDWLKQEVAE